MSFSPSADADSSRATQSLKSGQKQLFELVQYLAFHVLVVELLGSKPLATRGAAGLARPCQTERWAQPARLLCHLDIPGRDD
jgi:hypothetical protein